MQLPRDILDRTPEEGARRVALGFLTDASAAAARLREPEDAEALHDFRVGVRRLRSALRAYRPILRGVVRKKHRRALAALQEATGGGRDAEVFLDWIRGQQGHLTASQRHGAAWLEDRVAADKARAMKDVRASVLADFEKIEGKLRPQLGTVRLAWRLDEPDTARPRFGDAVASTIRDHVVELRDRAATIAGPADEAAAHTTRIRCKRLRYLLEPFGDLDDGAKDLVKRTKKLQTLLGDLHDLHVFGRALGDAIEDAAAEHARRLHALTLKRDDDPASMRREQRRNGRGGLLALTRDAKAQADALHGSFRDTWTGGGMEALVADAEALARRFERRRGADVEIERKLLLRALPAEARAGDPVEIDQGWLPGSRLRERLRKTTRADGRVVYTRTVKLGEGLTRTELEEETTPEVFDALWALTDGCRVRKRRWNVQVEDHLVEIDEFLDRDLVLAEIELDSEDEHVELPAWLAAELERDVTGEAAYVNLNLAR